MRKYIIIRTLCARTCIMCAHAHEHYTVCVIIVYIHDCACMCVHALDSAYIPCLSEAHTIVVRI